jgi:hypothetical protein
MMRSPESKGSAASEELGALDARPHNILSGTANRGNEVLTSAAAPGGDADIKIAASPTSTGLAGMWAAASAWLFSGTAIKWLLRFVVLAFLGFNVFSSLGQATGGIAEAVRPLLSAVGIGVGDTIKSTVGASAVGAKGVIDSAAGGVTGGINVIESSMDGERRSGTAAPRESAAKSGGADDTSSSQRPSGPQPDTAGSSTQASKRSKGGYCYIGEDRGFRSCIRVNDGSMCMSGEVFPTRAKCTDPDVRDTQATRTSDST